MTQEAARARLGEVAALWAVRYLVSADVVDAACDVLVAGLDGPTLQMLAGVSRRHADEEVPELIEDALREIGLTAHLPGTQRAEEAGIRVLAARALTGDIEPSALTSWAHLRYGHGTQPMAERLVDLDDAYDIVEHSDLTNHATDAEVLAEARRILATSPESENAAKACGRDLPGTETCSETMA